MVSLEILTLLLEQATDDSVEVAVGFLKEVGQKLTELSPRGIMGETEYLLLLYVPCPETLGTMECHNSLSHIL